ncbi:MAG: outer membrane protein assembly factor BamE [Aestuariivirga sp.]|uniref:outer membrane protein assembly factor BamE domain-containing protein n=1 Tax=Aestuariivirga sp. TaxID=2650926 RepID=UPI0025BDBD4D|nr:outer membrane protein assembly factor BamE [Aestuariivirga sp.]MCA3561303.1 outer membrane protein assembly factor BamE [Aestuariivirga sp.]
MRFATSLLAAAGLALFLAGCTPDVEHRGYMPKPGAFEQIATGMSKMEVEGIMGTPSTTASVQYKGDSFYYITQITTSKAFLTSETDRTVIAIRFNEDGKVKSYAQYGLQDGRVIDINTNATPVYGEDTSIISALLRTSKGTRTAPMLQGRI